MMNLLMLFAVEQSGYDGKSIALSGIITVFLGLILIAMSIAVFNMFFISHAARKNRKKGPAPGTSDNGTAGEKGIIVSSDVEEDIVVAIGATVELYKRLHLESLQSKITFKHGKDQSGWKSGYKYGHRV